MEVYLQEQKLKEISQKKHLSHKGLKKHIMMQIFRFQLIFLFIEFQEIQKEIHDAVRGNKIGDIKTGGRPPLASSLHRPARPRLPFLALIARAPARVARDRSSM